MHSSRHWSRCHLPLTEHKIQPIIYKPEQPSDDVKAVHYIKEYIKISIGS